MDCGSAANAFLGPFHASELERSATAGLGARRAVADLVGGRHVDKGLQLVVQVALGLVPPEDPPQDRSEAMQQCHAPSRTLVTASETRFQRAR
jgi:hypothetical protein